MKLLKFTIPFFILLFLTALVSQPQESALITQLAGTEQKALEAESRGNYPEAIKHLSQSFITVLKEYQSSNNKDQLLLAGIAEAYLHKLVSLHYENYQFTEAVKLLSGIESHRITPDFNAWVKYYLGDLYLKTNEINKARQNYESLGFINGWQIIGPFDNENGAGFNTPYPPEAEINPEAKYDGKKIPVSWRVINIDSLSGGYVNLTGYLRPNNNAVAYALVYVFSDKQQPVTLRIASEESIKLWINRKLTHSNDIHRLRCTIDQDIVPARLETGWNSVLVKTSTTRNRWGFRLRITDNNGNLIKGLRYEMHQPQTLASNGSNEKLPANNQDVIKYLEDAARKFPEQPNYYFYLGLIQSARANFDAQKPLDRLAFDKASLASFNSAYYHYYFAKSLAEESASLPEKEENQYREALEMVTGLAPDHILALTDIAEYYLVSLRNPTKSRQYLRQALRINPDCARAKYLETKLLALKGFDAEAYSRRKLLAEKHPNYLPAQIDYAKTLLEENRLDETDLIYRNILRNMDYTNQTAREGLINILVRQGKLKEALELYEVSVRLNPTQIESYLGRAKIMESQDDYKSALKEAERALEIAPSDATALALAGQYLYQLGKPEEAKQLWQQALRINPNYLWLQRYTEFAENTGQSFETPFKVDAETIVKDSQEIIPPSDFSAHYLLDQTVIRINKDGTSRKYIHQIIRILTEKGIKQFSEIQIPYNPETQRIKVLTTRLIYPDGERREVSFAGGNVIEMPALEKSVIIDLEYRIDDIQPGFFGDYFGDTFYFGTNEPTYKSNYILIAPADKPLYFHTKNIKIEPKITIGNDQTIYIWETFNVPGFIAEPLMPPWSEIAPLVQVSSYPAGEEGWKEFGKWYWHLIKRQYDMTDEMRQTLKRYIRPDMSIENKIKLVYYFVIGEIRYVAWEYGIHGWKPYRASTIFARRFGDCKDKATLINVFLNDMGIKSYPVLIYADESKGEDDLTLPMVEHFNHCISVAVPEDNNGFILNGFTVKEIYLDGTAALDKAGSLPSADRGAKVMVLNEEGGEIKQIPPNRPEDNSRTEKNTIRIDKKGNARLETKLGFTGERESQMRYYLMNPARHQLLMERMFGSRYGGTQVTRVTSSPLEDLETTVSIEVDASIPNFAAKREKDFSFKAIIFPQELSGIATQAERKFDLLLPLNQYPYEDTVTSEFVIPFGSKVKSIPENIELETKFGSFKIHYKAADDRIIITEKVSIKLKRISKDDYKAFREFSNRITREEAREIIIRIE